MNPFTYLSRPSTTWFHAGPSASFPDIDPSLDSADLSQPRPCSSNTTTTGSVGRETVQGCKAFSVSREDGTRGRQVTVQSGALEWDEDGDEDGKEGTRDGLKDQVLVFRYRGRVHAVDHKCPHASFPLSKGTPFDIEDFGVVLSAGLTCPKHGWSFDLITGQSDRAAYKLPVWEVEERKDGEVWVRRKPRKG